MNALAWKIGGKPVGIWIAICFHLLCIVSPLVMPEVFFPHGFEFAKRGMWQELLLFPGAAIVLVTWLVSIKALTGLLLHRLWGLMATQGMLALLIAFMLSFLPRVGAAIFLLMIPAALTNLGLMVNRRWFDEDLRRWWK